MLIWMRPKHGNVVVVRAGAVGCSVALIVITLTSSLSGLALAMTASSVATHAPILIASDSGFTFANGITIGTGTASDPYIIEGWEIDASTANGIDIRNTQVHFVIRSVYIHSGVGGNGIYLDNVANARVEASNLSNNENGIGIFSSEEVSLSNNSFFNNRRGINLVSSSNITIAENRVSNNEAGIVFFQSTNGLFSGNEVSRNSQIGVDVEYSTEATLRGNVFTENGVVIFSGASLTHLSSHTITPDNLVNGKPLYYHKDCTRLDIDGIPVGQLIVVNCNDVRVSNLQIAHTDMGIQMAFVDNANITGNVLSSNNYDGIMLLVFSNSSVTGNSIYSNMGGIRAYAVSNSVIADNDVHSNRDRGIFFFASANVTVSSNNITSNNVGLYASYSDGIPVHHNNFIDNIVQIRQWISAKVTWDAGYPSGGNFWSDYVGLDNCSGPDQNICPGPDGVGDTARVVGIVDWCSDYTSLCVVDNVYDRYPLVSPFSVVEATLNFDPDTIVLRSKGRYVTGYIELPSPYDVWNIDISTIRLNGTVAASSEAPVTIADHDGNGKPDLMVKFDLADVKALFTRPGSHTIQMTGRIIVGGRSFIAYTTVRFLS